MRRETTQNRNEFEIADDESMEEGEVRLLEDDDGVPLTEKQIAKMSEDIIMNESN